MHKVKKWLIPVLMICFLNGQIQAEPITGLLYLGAKVVSWGVKAGAKAKEVAEDVAAFTRMTAILKELKIVNEDTNDAMQSFNQKYNDAVSGKAYKDAVRLVYTHDRQRTHMLMTEFSSLQSDYTSDDGNTDGMKHIHSYAGKKKEKFYNWMDSVVQPTASDDVKNQNEQDLKSVSAMSSKGLDTMNVHQNAMNNKLTAEIADNTRTVALFDTAEEIKKQQEQEEKERIERETKKKVVEGFKKSNQDFFETFSSLKGFY